MIKPTPTLIFFCILFATIFSSEAVYGQPSEIDLRGAWSIYMNGGYQSVPSDAEFDEKVIYIEIDLLRNQNSFLEVNSPTSFSIFVNGRLAISEAKWAQLSIDSIRSEIGTPSMLLAIYQQDGVSGKRLKTSLVDYNRSIVRGPIIDRASTYFRDFVVLGVFIILVLLIIIVSQNPKLSIDFFSIRKLFAGSGSQDSLSDNRVTSGSNLLFQSFCSVLGGLLMTILFTYLKDQYTIATWYVHDTLWSSVLIWFLWSATILGAFFIKQLIIYLFAYLFGIGELALTHYFNLIRLLSWVLGISVAGISTYLIVHGQAVGVFENLYHLIGWALVFWVVLIFFKLSKRVGFSMFHLFSYLCATEIIPLIITIKVLYY